MRKQRTTWPYLMARVVLASCGLSVFACAQADKKAAHQPAWPEIVKAWKDAGAEGDGRWAKAPGQADEFTRADLRGTEMTDAGLKELAGLTNLQSLDIKGMQVTDAGLKYLAALKSLRTLSIHDSKVTKAGIAALQTKLPTCRIDN